MAWGILITGITILGMGAHFLMNRTLEYVSEGLEFSEVETPQDPKAFMAQKAA